jgi:hypothetical protein
MSNVDYLGFVAVADKTPLLVRAEDDETRDLIRDRHGPQGVIFTEADDMPSLEALLQAHQVGYAFLEAPRPFADKPIVAAPASHLPWREDARRRLTHALDDRERGDAIFHEDYAFVPALWLDGLDRFLEHAYYLLEKADTSEDEWNKFLVESATEVAAFDPAVSTSKDDAGPAAPEPVPLFTLADLALTEQRGALGGPPPLARSA